MNTLKKNLLTPISKEEEAPVDFRQGAYLGRMCQVLGLLVVLISMTTDSLRDGSIFVVIGTLIVLAGTHLYRTRHNDDKLEDATSH